MARIPKLNISKLNGYNDLRMNDECLPFEKKQ